MDRREYRRRLGERPNTVRMDELRQLLELYGWELVTVRGSHHVYTLAGHRQLVIPFRRPTVLGIYVRRALDETEAQDAD